MALTPVIEEYIYEFSKAVGDAYYAIKRGVGTETLPNTALFELAQLRSLTAQNLPYFGILKTSPSGFQIEPYPADTRYIRISSGQIAYNGSRITVNSQLVPIVRIFGSVYSTSHVYGVSIGFPLQEAQKATQTFLSSLTTAANVGDAVVYIADISLAQSLGFPLKAYLDTEFVIFTGVDNTGTGLLVNTSTGGISAYKGIGTKIHFIYESKVMSICGLPIDTPYQSGGNPSTFSYYPPMPTDWLPITNLLVQNPSNPELLHTIPLLTPARVATASASDATFDSYTGTTMTLAGSGTSIIDGITLTATDRVLFKDFPTGQKQYQGIYTYTNPTTYVRSTDLDAPANFITGLGVGITDGLVNQGLEFSYQGPDNPVISPPTTALPFGPITIDSFATADTKIEWPTAPSYTPLFNAPDSKTMAAAIDSARSALKQIRQSVNVTDLILAFERYTNSLSNNPQSTFNAYWSTLPFRARTNFSIGVSYDDLIRMEFPSSFAEAMYDIRRIDTQHTFAIFRGDLYASSSLFNVNLAPPADLTLTPISVYNGTTLTKGVYSYGATAINSQGESAAVYKTAEIVDNNFYMIELKGVNTAGATAYNFYRRSSLVGEQNEYLLNTYSGISSLSVPTDTSAIPINLTGIGISYGTTYGIKLDISNGTLLGGVGLKLRYDSGLTISNINDYVDVTLYTGVGTSAGTLIASGTPLYYNYLSSTFSEYVSRFSPINVGIGNTYYIVLNLNRAPVAVGVGNTNLYLSVCTSTGSTNTETKYDDPLLFPSLNNVLMSNSTYIKTYGFLDNGIIGQTITSRGVKLTGARAQTGRYLSAFVPTIIPPTSLSTLSIGPSAAVTELPITKNGLNITVIAKLGLNGTPVTMTCYIPKGTIANTRISLSPATLVDRIEKVYVTPSTNISELAINSLGQIQWSLYDFFTIETTPS